MTKIDTLNDSNKPWNRDKTKNWRAYNAGLKRQGRLTLWIDDQLSKQCTTKGPWSAAVERSTRWKASCCNGRCANTVGRSVIRDEKFILGWMMRPEVTPELLQHDQDTILPYFWAKLIQKSWHPNNIQAKRRSKNGTMTQPTGSGDLFISTKKTRVYSLPREWRCSDGPSILPTQGQLLQWWD